MKNKSYILYTFPILLAVLVCTVCPVTAQADSPFDEVIDNPNQPRVLLIGDSISIGYTVPVRSLLEGQANVHRIPVNGQFTTYGLEHIEEWLGEGRWDVIHFNWGIWDTHQLDKADQIISEAGQIRTSPAQYAENLNRLIDAMEATGARLIWASTTPIAPGLSPNPEDIVKFNAAAKTVMALRLIKTNDLYSAVLPRVDELRSEDGCHFTGDGSVFLAEKVARMILAELDEKGRVAQDWPTEQTEDNEMEGRRVLRFDHECLRQWGYEESLRQYFYVIEPETKVENPPLLVCLHSAGGNPDKFNNGQLELSGQVNRTINAGPDFVGLALNSGVDDEWWWGAEGIKNNPQHYGDRLTPVETRLLATIEQTVQKYGVDRNRIYLTGISMGGSGTLGLGLSHGDIFSALHAGVPAGSDHALYRLNNYPTGLENMPDALSSAKEIPPAILFFSQKDIWSKGMENLLARAHESKLAIACAWGPWGHANHYEMTNPAVYEFPWLSLRKNEAYPAFTNTSSDDTYPGHQSDGPDQVGQMNAFFRWATLVDEPELFSVELRLVQNGELDGTVEIPNEVVTDVTLRRLQEFRVNPDATYEWQLERAGKLIRSGACKPDAAGLLTVKRLAITAKPTRLLMRPTHQSSR